MPKKKRRRKPAPKPPKFEPLRASKDTIQKWLEVYPNKTPTEICIDCNDRLTAVGAPGRFLLLDGGKQVIYAVGNVTYSLAEGLVKLQEYEDAFNDRH